MRVTDHYNLNDSVEFVDVHVDRDNRLYVDPSSIRFWAKSGDKWALEAYGSIDAFFSEFLRRLWSTSSSENQSAREMLWQFHEPRETRLGMSAVGFDGSGASKEIGDAIWHSLSENPLCTLSVPILKRLEDIPLFVPDIADDRVSDLTTRLIFGDLARFTARQMEKHPELQRGAREGDYQVWDRDSKAWGKAPMPLPHVEQAGGGKAKPLLLVPKTATHRNLRMSHGKYWQGEILGSIQDDLTTFINGKPVAPRKEDLKKRDEYQARRLLNTKRTEEIWNRDNVNLLEAYRERVDEAYQPLSDEEINRRLG
ncbi:hypothetical protein AB0D66_04065 [Streptomyces sp. NPDC048270]|uniref:hypothetical protein n=1 Tax=Streptomyces sp. NPDC048270 TaxID=3154615 RepID=UPI0033E248A1